MFYKDQLNKTLQGALEEALASEPHEQLNLFEELALVRMAASESVRLYSAASQSADLAKREAGAGIMRTALQEVVKVCEAAARVHAAGKDKFSIHNLQHIINTIIRIAYEVFGPDEMDRAMEFESLIKQRIRLAGTNDGTTLTPDQDAVDMDDTVPKAPTEDEEC